MLFMCVFIGALAFMSMCKTYETFGIINNQNKYNIRNPIFRKKYIIISEDDENKISNIFNENAVLKIIETKPEITEINCQKKNLSLKFGINEQLSYSLCEKYLVAILNQAKILEDVE